MQSPPPPNPLSRHTHLQEEQRRANEGHSALQPLHRLQEVARAGDTAAYIVGGYRVGVQIPLQRRGRGVDDWMGGKGSPALSPPPPPPQSKQHDIDGI